ncbi:uncharacterized protein LOC143748467 [Siphateles boraxobius]|uniref:uncharacterized protein LOC143748467 n=1 Tax=Siphateles boraxobius TaxID=180520 RepID=UPI0040640E66
MACVCSAWLRWGALLSAVFCLCAQECVEEDHVVTEMSQDIDLPSECVLSCTVLTYRQVIDGQQKLTVLSQDSRPGESDDFCWFIHSRCSTWDEVFVVLSIKESVAAESIGLQTTWPPHLSPAHPHMSHAPPHLSPAPPHPSPALPHLSRVPPDACGLRFDVMPHLKLLKQRMLCVRPHGIMGHHLQCPPYLVIVKKKTE